MAWVTQEFKQGDLSVSLLSEAVSIQQEGDETPSETLFLQPECQADAHGWALMLRRAARRLEEIGKVMQ